MASEYLKKKYQDVKPDAPVELTPAEKRRNWWYYNKWYVCAAAALVVLVAGTVWRALHRVEPDYRVAYVGSLPLLDDAVASLETALASLGEDLNGDGAVVVSLRQYVDSSSDTASIMAAQVSLLADVSAQESFLFLLEDPEAFQQQYHTLCRLDGSLPEEGDDSTENSVLAWNACPVLRELELGDYDYDIFGGIITGHTGDLYSRLYIGRRGFWVEDEDPGLRAGYTALWEKLTDGAAS